jgi:hypothetical protein
MRVPILVSAILLMFNVGALAGESELKNDATFQKACNSSTNLRDWEYRSVCWCYGQYTKKFKSAVSALDLENNPDWVKQPNVSNYSELSNLSKELKTAGGPFIESGMPIKSKDGKWSCRASFFGVVTGSGSLEFDWRGR